MTPPADPRAIATEALYLTAYEGATVTWEHDDGDVRITHPDGSQTIFYPADLAPLIAHAGTHYATLAHALLAALGEREAMLADLPHALDACDCPSPGAWARECREPYPKEHYDAIDRVRNAAIDRLRAGEE